MFHFTGFASFLGCLASQQDGFPHSDIHASTVACTYTWLFAAGYVLLRLLLPRHPPCAFSTFTYLLLAYALFNDQVLLY